MTMESPVMKYDGDKTDARGLIAYAQSLEEENERLRAQLDHLAASTIFIDKCQCESPLVKCDHMGCRCQICGKLG